MKRTVLVIAHNESLHIAECLESIENQAVSPDEILLIAHNCTDDTVAIAKKFPNIQIEEYYTDEKWPIYPRIRGFELAKNEVIACLDGDSIVDSDWLEKITKPLSEEGVIGVGGNIRFKSDFVGNICAWWFFGWWNLFPSFHFYFWGANFACKKSAYIQCGGLSPLLQLKEILKLHYWAEDCYLSLALEKYGKIFRATNALVYVYPKPKARLWLQKMNYQTSDKVKLFRFFKI